MIWRSSMHRTRPRDRKSSTRPSDPCNKPAGPLFVLVMIVSTTPGSELDTFHDDPTSSYERCRIEGFSLFVNPRLHDHPVEGGQAMDELNKQLANVARVVPSAALAKLRQIPIWIEWEETPGLGEFHWDSATLTRQHRNTQKSRSVKITNARHLVEWAKVQPWAVLHELAHGYHCTVLGQDDQAVIAAFDQAMASGKYDQVEYALGGKKPAYAKNNRYEYFAELSEAYFGKNDFEPTNRDELARFDPVGERLMRSVWGDLQAAKAP